MRLNVLNISPAQIRHPLMLILCLAIMLTLSACGGSGGSPQTTTLLKGSIGVAKQRSSALSTQSSTSVSISSLNDALKQLGGSESLSLESTQEPIRGLNASVLSNVISSQNGDAKSLFSLSNQSIIAVDKSGNVLASASINEDGSWAIDIKNEVWKEAGVIGLMQGYKSNDGWVCEKPLEYEDDSGEKKPALFGYEQTVASAGFSTQQLVRSTGLFNYDPDSGNPTEDENESDVDPVQDDDFQPKCENENIVETSINARFSWATPSGISESSIYQTGVAYALDTRNKDNPAFVNVAPIDSSGQMTMPIFKPQATVVPLALVLSDTDLLEIDSFDQLDKVNFPLTPTFDLNSAIRYANPSEPSLIPVGDDGYRYDPSQTRGGMAYVSGKVLLSSGSPAQNALVLAVIDSADVLAFNLALTDSTGHYDLLLPATGKLLPYYIIALSADETEVGIPKNIPSFSDSAQDIRFSINEVANFTGADIQLIKGEGSGNGNTGGSISGTLSAPAGQDIQGSLVYVCVSQNECSSPVTISSSGSSAAYSIDNLAAGNYFVVAGKDLDSDGKFDLYGVYSKGEDAQPVSPPASNINFSMQDFSKTTPGGGGEGELSISGRLTAPAGGDVKDTSVFACYLDADNKCTDKSVQYFIKASGNSTSYQFSNLEPGRYALYADKDVNLDKEFFTAGDYTGCYGFDPAQNTCAIVDLSSDVSNLDIEMNVIGGDSGGGEEGSGFSGTVSSGNGEDLRGTALFICNQTDGCQGIGMIEESKTSQPYQINNVPAARWQIFAYRDTNGNKQTDTGDLFGCYSADGKECTEISPPKTQVDIVVFTVSGQGSLLAPQVLSSQGWHNPNRISNFIRPQHLINEPGPLNLNLIR